MNHCQYDKRTYTPPRHLPAIETTVSHEYSGLTYSKATTKSYTYTIAQLKRAVMLDGKLGNPVDKNQLRLLLQSVIHENRHELFGVELEYKYSFAFNSYHQFRYVECNEFKLTHEQLFVKLEEIYS